MLAYAERRPAYKLHTDTSTSDLGAVLYQQKDGKDRVDNTYGRINCRNRLSLVIYIKADTSED